MAFQSLQLPQIIKLDTTNLKTQSINFENGLYEGVFDKIDQRMDLPKVFESFEFTKATNNNSQTIVQLQNGQFLVSLSNLGSGKVYLFAIPSDETSSNLLKHALFVPTLIKMSILSLKPSPVYYITAINEVITLNRTSNFSEKPLHILKDDGSLESQNVNKKIDIIPEHRLQNNATVLFTQNQITEAGYYKVEENNMPLKDLAFNYNRKESDMYFMNQEDLQKQIDENGLKNIEIITADEKMITNTLQDVNEGKKLWKLFLILALIFLLSEIIIIRVFKN